VQEGHWVISHFQWQAGHTPRVSKVFQLSPHPPIWRLQLQRLAAFGLQQQHGQ